MVDSPITEVAAQFEPQSDTTAINQPAQDNQISSVSAQKIGYSNNSDQEPASKPKPKLALKILLPLFIVFLIAIFAGLINYFFFVPRAKAEVFVSEMSRDFDLTMLDIQKLATSGANDKNSFEIARGSLYIIPGLRGSLQIEKDISEEIPLVDAIISRIKSVKDKQGKLAKPLEVQDLNTKLDKYYLALGDATNELRDYENFQLKMIEAQGAEYNAELSKFGQAVTSGIGKSANVAYFTKLLGLGEKSIERLKALGEPPKDQINFYHYIVDSDVDRTDSLKKVLVNFGSPQSMRAMSDYLKRQAERDLNNINSTNALVETSLLRTSFDKVITQEDVMREAISSMKKKYGIAEPVSSQSTQSTSSASP